MNRNTLGLIPAERPGSFPGDRRAVKPVTVALIWRKSSKDLVAVRSYLSLRLSLQSSR